MATAPQSARSTEPPANAAGLPVDSAGRPLDSAEPRHDRGATPLRQVLTLLFLALQLGLPLHYYLWSDTPQDERFAWRMFSPTRMITCRVQFLGQLPGQDQAQPLRLNREVADPWLNWMRRGQVRVARAFADYWCKKQGAGAKLHAELVCKQPDSQDVELLSSQEQLCGS